MKEIKVVTDVIRDGDRIFVTERGYGDFKVGWEFPDGKVAGVGEVGFVAWLQADLGLIQGYQSF